MSGIAVIALFAATLPHAVVLQPVANMYAQPSEDSSVVSQAIYGANVELVQQQDGWAKVRTADEYTGWVPMRQLLAGKTYGTGGRVGEVRSLFAHLYREDDVTKHAPLLTVPFETRLAILEEQGRWAKAQLPDGRTAWVQTGDLAFDRQPMTIPEMLAFSKRFLGLPYTWGGTSSYGYDCSGFTQMLERQRGVLMPRDAGPQAEWSGNQPVARAELQPGDLLYFGGSEKHITHTGMYLGDGKFINATTYQTPMVRIDDLNEPRWTRLLVAMRRPVPVRQSAVENSK
jgi:cell wall-associated NlpC family hydrolase